MIMARWKKTRLALVILSTLVEEIALAVFILFGLPKLGVSLPLGALIGMMSGLAAYGILSYRLGSRALAKKPLAGFTDMTGSLGTVIEALCPRGVIKINNELWEAECTDYRIEIGEKVVVVGRDGLKLMVRRCQAASTKTLTPPAPGL